MEWIERGGTKELQPPTNEAFGSKLLNDTVKRQFGGAMEHFWEPAGLRVRLTLPLRVLAN